MKVACFDLETSSLYANSGIILCASIKPYGSRKITTFRADKYPSWKTNKSDNEDLVRAIMAELAEYDILIAHNGQYFDKAWLNTVCLKYDLIPALRSVKFVDPVLLARRHLRMARNSLAALIDYFDIQEEKSPIRFAYWIEASHDGNKKSLDYIVKHCEKDVIALERVYDKVRRLVKQIDDGGSAFR